MPRTKLKVTAPEPEQQSPDVDDLFERITDAKPVKREWLLPGRIVAGGVAIIEGDTSVGKSVLLASIAASVTTGAAFLGRTGHAAGHVLWLTAEADPGRDLVDLVTAAGGHAPYVHCPKQDEYGDRRRITFPTGIPRLRQLCEARPIKLVIVEPLMSFLSSGTDPENGPDCRAALDPVQAFAMSTGVTVIFTRGLRKDRHGPRTTHGAGSATIGDISRSTLVIDAPDRNAPPRFLVAVKCEAGKLAPTVAYEITPHANAVRLTAIRELSGAEASAAEVAIEASERSQLNDAEALLRSCLKSGACNASIVIKMATAVGISSTTLYRARQRLGVANVRHGYGDAGYSEWTPPKGGFPEIKAVSPYSLESMEPMKETSEKPPVKSIDSIDSKESGDTAKTRRKRRTASTKPASDATME